MTTERLNRRTRAAWKEASDQTKWVRTADYIPKIRDEITQPFEIVKP
jgi:hypothetical protein